MPSTKLEDFNKIKREIKYELEDFKNPKEWTIHKIFNEAWFNVDEEKRRLIEADIVSRGHYALFNKYILEIHRHIDNIVLKDKAYYYLEANNIKPDINTYTELDATYETLKMFGTELAIIPKNKTLDSNASRKGVQTKQVKERILKPKLKLFININYPVISARRTAHIIKLLTSC